LRFSKIPNSFLFPIHVIGIKQKIESYLRPKNEETYAEFEEMWLETMKLEPFDKNTFWEIWNNNRGRTWRPKFTISQNELEECERQYAKYNFFIGQTLRRQSSHKKGDAERQQKK